MNDCIMTAAQVEQGFLAAPPLINQTIRDMSQQIPSWYAEQWELVPFPLGNGAIAEEFVFRGDYPAIERGFSEWKKVSNASGCDPCDLPDSSYNWSTLGGHSMSRKRVELMSRDYKSLPYCVKEIQTTAHFQQVMDQVVKFLYLQVRYIKEFNIGQNFFTGLAKKYVIDGQGAKPNISNPYVYRPLGGVRISTLSMTALEFFYEQMRRMPECIPYGMQNGSPVFALTCSHQLLAHLYRDDASLRWDVRYSNLSDDLVSRYNFVSSIRGQFIPAPVLYPRRFKESGGVLVEILPFLNNVPGEAGTHTEINPEYISGPGTRWYEEVLLHGKAPFKIYYLPTAQALGPGMTYGPEFGFLENWAWINIATNQDPMRRMGFFATNATIGLCPQYSEGIYGLLCELPQQSTMAVYIPEPTCPPSAVECENVVPAVPCPCQLVLSLTADPTASGYWFITFSSSVSAGVGDSIQLGLDNGAYVTVLVAAASTDRKSFRIYSTANLSICKVTTVYCDETLGCSSDVIAASDCRSNQTGYVDIILKHPIKAGVGADILGYMGDGSTQHFTIAVVDLSTNTYTITYTAGYGPTDDPTGMGATLLTADLLCDRHGIIKVCVPPETDPTCPSCTNPTVTPCVS